jgi:hypothetical protein
MIVKLYKKPTRVEVKQDNGFTVKEKDLTPDEFVSLNRKLCGDRLKFISKCNKFFKARSITYHNVSK